MDSLLRNEEKAVFDLRGLYSGHGYTRYKVSKFEEYDLYAENKDFLKSNQVITFNDVSGKLMALKPDVTMSIIKDYDRTDGYVSKLYYDENVYRVSSRKNGFSEIRQTGLECLGDIGLADKCEVILLAAESLAKISDTYVLELSHMGLVSAVLDYAGFDAAYKSEALSLIESKNAPSLTALCDKCGLAGEMKEKVILLSSLYGSAEKVTPMLETLAVSDAASQAVLEIKTVFGVLRQTASGDKISFDFSVVSDLNYYDGIVINGYIDKVPTAVLSGGQYNKLVKKMGRDCGGIGFAVYIDLLDRLDDTRAYDADALLLYSDDDNAADVLGYAEKLIGNGQSVLVQRKAGSAYCRKTVIFNGGAE